MNNQMIIFEGIEIDVMEADSKIWFRATSVCQLLFTKDNAFRFVQMHCRENQYREWQIGKGRPALYVTEAGLYRLIMRSKAPVAVKFQDWVCDEVLPNIRKNGFYATQEMHDKINACFLLMRQVNYTYGICQLKNLFIVMKEEPEKITRMIRDNEMLSKRAYMNMFDLAELLGVDSELWRNDFVIEGTEAKFLDTRPNDDEL